MTIGRKEHVCGLIVDSKTGAKRVVVAGGYGRFHLTGQSTPLPFTEFLDLDQQMDPVWTDGPVLPIPISAGSGVNFDGGRKFALIAGFSESKSQSLGSIFLLQCSSGNCTWTRMEQELKYPRDSAVAMMIPDSIVKCSQK